MTSSRKYNHKFLPEEQVNCKLCNTLFTRRATNQAYCGRDCARKANIMNMASCRIKNEAAASLPTGTLRNGPCLKCGKPVEKAFLCRKCREGNSTISEYGPIGSGGRQIYGKN